MPRNDPIVSFRPVVKADLPMLADWMKQPHWQEWWGDVDTELGYIKDMLAGRDSTEPFIFQIDGNDTGYIQYWRVADNRVEPFLSDAPWMLDVDDDAISVDLSIGEGANVSRGIGSTILTAFVAKLRKEGFANILIDPDKGNARAIRAYEKAGFALIKELEGKTGQTYLMRHTLS